MNREQARVAPWSKGDAKFFRYKSDYSTPIVPIINADRFPRIFCPFANDETQHVKALRSAGFTVMHTGGATCRNGEEFCAMLDAAPEFDAVFACAPDGMNGISAIILELIDRGLPFILYMNFDGLPMSRLRYDYLKNNQRDLTMILFNTSPSRFIDEDLISTEEGALYDRFFLAYKMFDRQFVFAESQCNLFEVIDNA